MRWSPLLALLLPTLTLAAPAKVAVVVGVNRAPSAALQELRYADDDAVAYAKLLSGLGFELTLLARPDARRAAEAAPFGPLPAERATVLAALERAAQTAAAGPGGDVIFAFNGHGNGIPQFTLEDGELTLDDLMAFAGRLKRSNTRLHLVMDACHAAALSRRGPGAGRELTLALDPRRPDWPDNVGLLLAKGARSEEAYESGTLQAGVFSHLIRSAAAVGDVDGDGTLSYPEVVAFMSRAGEQVETDALRPEPVARAPRDSHAFLALTASPQVLTLGAEVKGHCWLRTPSGPPVIQFRKSALTVLTLHVPPGYQTLELACNLATPTAPQIASAALRVGEGGLSHEPLGVGRAPDQVARGVNERAVDFLWEGTPTDLPLPADLRLGEAGDGRPVTVRWRAEAALWLSELTEAGVEVQVSRRFFDLLPDLSLELGLNYQRAAVEAVDQNGAAVEAGDERWTLSARTVWMPRRWVDLGVELAGGPLVRTVGDDTQGDAMGRARLLAGMAFSVGDELYLAPTLAAGAAVFPDADGDLRHPLELSLGLALELP